MSASELILVTGANGFIGSHLVEALASRGRRVRAFVAPNTPVHHLLERSVEIYDGDLRDARALQGAVQGVGLVYHLGAYNNLWSADWDLPNAVNIRGTENLLQLARAAGVRRFVYTSSATLYQRPSGPMISEADFLPQTPKQNAYEYSKYVATCRALEAARADFEVLVLSPTAPVGPGDRFVTGPGRLVVDFLSGRIPGYMEAIFNLVDVREVALAHLQADCLGASGEHYIVGGLNYPLTGIFHLLEDLTGLPAPRMKVPYPLAFVGAWLSERVSDWITNRPPSAPLEGVRLARESKPYDCRKAQSAFQMAPADVRRALLDAVNWFYENGYVPGVIRSPVLSPALLQPQA